MAKASSDMPALLVFVADFHTNSVAGLNPPTLRRELGSRHHVGKVGRELWRRWLEFWQLIEAKKVERDATVYTFAIGDLGDIDQRGQLITDDEVMVLDAMAEVAEPLAKVSDYIFIDRGTESHVGGNGRLEEWLARDLTNAVHCSEEVASWWVVDARIGGLKIMATHHPPTSSGVPWGLDPAVARAANHVFNRYADADLLREKPDICVWAHAHTRGAQGMGQGNTWAIFLPPWQLTTGYGHRLGRGFGPRKVGGLWMLVKDGKVLDWDFERWRVKERSTWSEP